MRYPSLGRSVSTWTAVVALAAVFAAPTAVSAAGIEDTVAGTFGLGRAASFGRVRDFMAVLQNPANLSLADKQAGIELRLPMLRACFDRAARPDTEYRQSEQGVLLEHFDRVCNEALPTPTLNAGFARTVDNWGWGVGIFTPAAVGSARYGDDTIRTLFANDDEPYATTDEGIESPNRQLGLERRGITAYLMAGLGAQLTPNFRFGVSAGVGMLHVYNKTVVSSVGGTFNDQEVLNEITATDWAVPRMVSSMVYTLVPGLEAFGVLQYHGDAQAKGRMVLTANGIQGAPLQSCAQESPGSRCYIDGVEVNVPFAPLEATFGLRYAALQPGKKRSVDPLSDERWDVELDVSWAQTRNVEALGIDIHNVEPSDPAAPRVQFGNGANASTSFVRFGTEIPKNWKDTWTLRLGGDYNVIRKVLALRTGVSFMTRAVTVPHMNIDFWPVRKVGLHFGASAAINDYRITLAYAHLFYQSVIVNRGTGKVKDIATVNEAQSDPVNEGRYDAVQDIVALQVNRSF